MKNIIPLILAAGKGTRMKSPLPKVLHLLRGKPLIYYPLELTRQLKLNQPTLIVGKNYQSITSTIKDVSSVNFSHVVQDPPKGTGHAIMVGSKAHLNKSGHHCLVLSGDMPLIKKETLQRLIKKHLKTKATISLLTATLEEPGSYGRILRDETGLITGIKEAKDATPVELEIEEINVGVYLFDVSFLKKYLPQLTNKNKQKEYYLTDLVHLAVRDGLNVQSISVAYEWEGWGINSQADLALCQQMANHLHLHDLMQKGIRMELAHSIVLDEGVKVQEGSLLMGPCYLKGNTTIGKQCIIEPGSMIKNSQIKNNVHIKANCYLDHAIVGDNSQIGPFAHLRPDTILKEGAKLGNFVETKKTVVGAGSKINHLSYIGDANLGKNVNIGAGTITCNYDGKNKYKTILGDGVFVGSDTQFVAPVTIGKNAFIGAGSTITRDVRQGSLALTRSDQKEIKNWKSPIKEKK